MQSEYRAIIAKLQSLHPEDYLQIGKCWDEEVKILTSNIDKTTSFITNECTDDELYWMSEVFEEIAHSESGKNIIEAARNRAEKIIDNDKRKSVFSEIEYAEKII